MPEFLITYVLQPVESPNSDVFARLFTGETVPKESAIIAAENPEDAVISFIMQDIQESLKTGQIAIISSCEAQ